MLSLKDGVHDFGYGVKFKWRSQSIAVETAEMVALYGASPLHTVRLAKNTPTTWGEGGGAQPSYLLDLELLTTTSPQVVCLLDFLFRGYSTWDLVPPSVPLSLHVPTFSPVCDGGPGVNFVHSCLPHLICRRVCCSSFLECC